VVAMVLAWGGRVSAAALGWRSHRSSGNPGAATAAPARRSATQGCSSKMRTMRLPVGPQSLWLGRVRPAGWS